MSGVRPHEPAGLLLERGQGLARTSRGAPALVSTRYTPAYDIYLGEGDGSSQEASRYQVWTRKDALTAPALSVLERRDGSVLRVPERSRVMHRIPGGVPYHIEHLFGFWRTTAADTIFIRAEAEDGVYYTLIVATNGEDVGTDTV